MDWQTPKLAEKDIEKITNRILGVSLNDHKSLQTDIL